MKHCRISFLVLLACIAGAQTPQYVIKSFAGAFPLGDGGPASSALLYSPQSAVMSAGSLYILDSQNYRIRRVTPAGTISTFAQINNYGYDIKVGSDRNFYVSASGAILKITPEGTVSRIAGTATWGYSGDGGAATAAQVATARGIAIDGAGNIYFTDNYNGQSRVRMVTAADGKISTIAGTPATNFNGDGQPATSANLNNAIGIAIDSKGALYVADNFHYRIRKFTVGGTISTIAGTGNSGVPVEGSASASPVGSIIGMSMDNQDNLYAADSAGYILRIGSNGSLTRLAGGGTGPYSPSADEAALPGNLLNPSAANIASDGSVYVTDGTHLVRQVTPDGRLKIAAGKLHFGGDGGPASAALFNRPTDMAIDAQGNIYVADADNFRIRKITPDGMISTFAGNGLPWTPTSKNQLPVVTAMTIDSSGTLYVAGWQRVFSITPNGTITQIAGAGFSWVDLHGGDSGPAIEAPLGVLTGITVDKAQNVYIADGVTRKVRKITPDGNISLVAGNGTIGYTGDGGLATSASLSLGNGSLALDSKDNLYIGDSGNYAVRMVTPSGIISTVVGNGTFGRPDNVKAQGSPFSSPASIHIDPSGVMYIASQNYGDLYRLTTDGTIARIVGNGNRAITDGTPANQTYFFTSSLEIDPSGDLYSLNSSEHVIRKLVLNSPTTLTITDGDKQTAEAGKALPRALRVQVFGRAGVGVSGQTVNFAVKSGVATLSASSLVTDATGVAGVGVTLGSTPGDVQITASVAGSPVAPVTFTATATAAGQVCASPKPTLSSVATAGDFGGSATVAPGSWIEIKGTNFAAKSRIWEGSDFRGANAPTSLENVSVTIGGRSAFVYFVSPLQVNVQVPGGLAAGDSPVVVTTSACSISDAHTVRIAAASPGLLAPAAFRVGGRQYVAATFTDGVFVGRANLVQGAAFRPAVPGDTITIYGVGFGPGSPDVAPGIIVGVDSRLTDAAVTVDSTPAAVAFAGLAPGVMGLYQFNFTVPRVAAGDHTITIRANGAASQGSLYLTTAAQ